jgi:hypothetical protein
MARDVTLHAKMTRRKRRTSSRLRTRVIFCPCADAWVVRLSGPTSHVRRADLQFCNPNTQSCIRHFYWTFIAPHPCISFLFRWTFISFKSTTVPTFSTSGRGNPNPHLCLSNLSPYVLHTFRAGSPRKRKRKGFRRGQATQSCAIHPHVQRSNILSKRRTIDYSITVPTYSTVDRDV